jgi:hypothetical protein
MAQSELAARHVRHVAKLVLPVCAAISVCPTARWARRIRARPVAAVLHLVIDALTGEQQRALAQISEAITARADAPTP